jgi:PKD repeat protein
MKTYRSKKQAPVQLPDNFNANFKISNKSIRSAFLIFFFCTLTIFSYSQFTDSGIDLGITSSNNCQWGDYDNDGDLDIFLPGSNPKIFRNDGYKTFTDLLTTFPVKSYAGTWIDYDNDNDLDIFMGTRLYKNQGSDTFSEIVIEALNFISIGSVTISSVDAVDYDNDGDEDLLMGLKGEIFILNNREGEFFLVDQDLADVEQVGGSYINSIWVDTDNDGHFDILNSNLHKNNTLNQYLPDVNFNITNPGNNVSVGDYDSDGFSDALYADRVPPVMMKNTNGVFTNANLVSLQSVSSGWYSEFGDFDNDGNLDCIIMTPSSAKLCSNDGSGDFTITTLDLSSMNNVFDMDLGDYDNDGDLDLILAGRNQTKIFDNTLINSNSQPSAPTNLTVTITGNSVLFSWDQSADDETPSPGLSYNICLINTTLNDTVKTPMANLTTGNIHLPGKGNTQNNNFWEIKGLKPGNYKWTVQAIDHSFQGSPFASFETFQIISSATIAPTATQTLEPDETGTTLTVSETVAVAGRQWVYSKYPGGPYINIIPGETDVTYTPQFQEDGHYFIICKSVAGSDTLFSNEVMVEVLPFTETIISTIPDYLYGTIEPGDSDNDGDIDLLFTGDQGTNIYVNTGGTFSVVNITTGLYNSDAEWFDYNNDNKLDFIITGSVSSSSTSDKLTRIFINQGGNVFDELTHNIPGLIYGSLNAGDYDHDGDPDILICGMDVEPITKIYRNDNGAFIDTETPINQVTDGMAIWGDYDNDDDLDIFLSGTDFSGNPFTGLYRNDGDNGFQQIEYSFKPCQYSFIEFGDYDNDTDIDILISGMDPDSDVETTIYKNLGDDQFQKIILTKDMGYNYVRWLDYNNDGLLDILLAGNEWYSLSLTEYSRVHRILKNDGNDIFKDIQYMESWVNNSRLLGLVDLDNDSDIDLIQAATDFNTSDRYVSVFYNNSYLIKTSPPAPDNLTTLRRGKEIILSWNRPAGASGEGVSFDLMLGMAPDSSDIVSPLSQLDNGYRMVAKQGSITDTTFMVTLSEKGTYYWKVQTINNSYQGSAFSEIDTIEIGDYFVEQTNPFIPVRYQVDFDWGDYDDDGDQDLLLCGKYWSSPDWLFFNNIYENTGNGTFNSTPAKELDYEGYEMKWIDLDNDNDLDIAGCTKSGFKIFENEGAGIFSEAYNRSCTHNFSYGDYNNDGLIDLMVNNNELLINRGGFLFESIYLLIGYYTYKTAYCFSDLNNDLEKDLILIDRIDNIVKLFKWTETGYENIMLDLPFFYDQSTDFDLGDIDNDGDLDIIITGNTTESIKETILLRNNGNMDFSRVNSLIRGTSSGAVSLGDYDNDNDLDILLSGDSFSVITKIYENKGNFSFEEIDYGISGQYQGKTGWADYDDDGDLDILVSGTAEGYGAQSKLYRNDLNISEATILAPNHLTSANEGYGIILSWQDSLNTGTSYNVRVGTETGTCNIVSPMADLTTGKRKVSRIGNADLNLKYKLDSLPVGTYYWSVQAVNNAYKGSSWADEQTFTISVVNAGFAADTVCTGDSTHFTDLTLTSGEDIISWYWDFGDGESDIVQNPVHLYSSAGNYQVKLVVNTTSYADSITKTVVVKAVPLTDFTVDLVCQGTPTSVTNTTDNNGLTINAWLWNYGDGGTSTLEDPGSHGYLNPGDYNITLWAFADNGCSASVQKTATVASYPSAGITADGPLVFCKGDSVTLSVPEDNNYTYNWLMNGTGLTGTDSSNYVAKVTGNYSVEVVNNTGSCKTTSSQVAVTAQDAPAAPAISASGVLEFCQGDSVDLSVTNTVEYFYQWKLNGGAVGADSSRHSAKSSGTYSLTVSNSAGCAVDATNKINITANPAPPLPTVSLSGSTTFCHGDTVELSVTENTAYTYQWENGGSVISEATSNSYKAVSSGSYRLSITNSYNCVTMTSPVNVTVKTMPYKPVISYDNYESGECMSETPIKLYPDQEFEEYNYQWKRNGIPVTDATLSYIEDFLTEGDYSVEADLDGCTTESDAISIFYKDAPEKPTLSAQGPTVWYFTCSNTDADEYKWYCNGNLITGAKDYYYVAGRKMGDYQVSIRTEQGGCFTRSDIVTIPTGDTGLDDIDPSEGLKLYPNPTTGLFTIEMDNNIFGELLIRIITESGKEIVSLKLDKTTEHFLYEVDLSRQPQGLYIINLLIDRYIAMRKIIVE